MNKKEAKIGSIIECIKTTRLYRCYTASIINPKFSDPMTQISHANFGFGKEAIITDIKEDPYKLLCTDNYILFTIEEDGLDDWQII